MVLPEMDEVLRQLAAVDADDAPFAVATIVVAVLAALVLGPGDPAVFGKRGEIEARGQEQREGDHSSFSSCTGISRGSMGTKPWVTVIEAIRSCPSFESARLRNSFSQGSRGRPGCLSTTKRSPTASG